ncbi:bifunctional phosphoribosyl-AMP cyclohydrolase/phosphoribosyl-ATP diphosphatase HisIE [Blattabacterium cuenoti]|uniref:bifunctional phosphoribosyl-AMP cyclohydrolase/phosphoribosyl-ATP diphosphatase HisIE n=1 Tax=Blattabacterium cuenoti TaxID=1653831 RepID=UPI00163B621B|nr:bifunctional phosphoribosyl-AMP cyclohydrolase/phosphoribosyl-ATP diphosphatase HisIE [Blattabacterium cuenoti]
MKNKNINFKNELIPTIIQDEITNKVLMLGYMNEESYNKSINEKKVTFYSRSKKRLWTKGEISNNYLIIKEVLIDCDGDTLLIKVKPLGPTCHSGEDTCWNEINNEEFLFFLEKLIYNNIKGKNENSYINKLFRMGVNRIAQKLGEEAIEVVLESKDNNKDLFLNESADLLFHYLILLRYKNISIKDVIKILENRHKYMSINRIKKIN